MKITPILFFFLFLNLSFSQEKKQSFTDSGFEANFVKKPTFEKKDIETKIGLVNMNLYLSEGDDYMIMITVAKYPSEKVEDSKLKNMLLGAKNGALKSLSKQLEGSYIESLNEDFMFDSKYEGIKFVGTISDVETSGQIFIKNNQMYQIMLVGNTESADVINFTKSFALIP